jgi:hypothetical protein
MYRYEISIRFFMIELSILAQGDFNILIVNRL